MITPNQSSHWYTPDGEPAYNATLRDARKEKLYPSVTQVLGILAKPAVESWAVNLMSEVCYINQSYDGWGDGETLDEYRARIEPIYTERRKEAAIRGSAIHDFAEAYLNGDNPEPVKGYERQCELLAKWCDDNIHAATCEQSFSVPGAQGYGGRIDAYGTLKDGRRFILDFKTQDLKGKSKPNYYQEFALQLSAYKHWLDTNRRILSLVDNGLSLEEYDAQAISVVIDTGDIQSIHVKGYTDEEMRDSLRIFQSILATWYAIKGL